jgi:vacuolar-type H+-ATPase subunit F/Vma7
VSDFFVIAEEELVLAFRLVGIAGASAAGREEALEAFLSVTSAAERPGGTAGRSRPRILVLTEEIADLLSAEARAWQLSGEYPLIVEIPPQGERRPGRKGLVDAIREAIGVSV